MLKSYKLQTKNAVIAGLTRNPLAKNPSSKGGKKAPPPPKGGNSLRLGWCKFVKSLSRAYFPPLGGLRGAFRASAAPSLLERAGGEVFLDCFAPLAMT